MGPRVVSPSDYAPYWLGDALNLEHQQRGVGRSSIAKVATRWCASPRNILFPPVPLVGAFNHFKAY
jgi:hypothetical protein